MMNITMVEICPKCGLPNDLCVCGTISKEQQKIKVFTERRKWRRAVTIIEGIDKNELEKVAHNLKSKCACGGTAKNDQIILQGDHRDKTKGLLVDLGFIRENIEVA